MEINYNFVHLNDLCNLLNIKISHMFHRTLDKNWHFDNHCNDYNRLYFILGGHGYLYNKNECVDLVPNNIYLIPAYSSYNYRCDEYMEQIFVHFKLSIIPNKDLLATLDRIVTIPSTEKKMEEIKDVFYRESISSAVFCQNFIRDISFKLLEPYAEEIDDDIETFKKYKDLYRYIGINLSAQLRVAEVCKHLCCSQTYIGRQFKADTGKTIKEYIQDLLLEKMKQLLQANYSLQKISNELKFNDLSYCSKFFTKQMGITPREYMKKHIL